MTSSKISIADIRINGGTQSRASIDQNVVGDYADAIAAGDTFPPVVVFFDGKAYWLADGFHRYEAYARAKIDSVQADVRQGTQRDAILFSVGANASHGLRRTNDDKRRAVLTLLNDKEWGAWPDAEIARFAAVGRHFVRKLREAATCTPSTSEPVLRKYINKHGKEAVMNVARIGSSQAKSRPLTKAEDRIVSAASGETVYLLANGGRVKVGWSGHGARQRVGQLLTATPDATVIAIAAGGRKDEQNVHRLLECERDTGEWFVCSVEHALSAMCKAGLSPVVEEKPDGAGNEPELVALATSFEPDLDQEAESVDPVEAKLRREFRSLSEQAQEDAYVGLTLDLQDCKAVTAKLRTERDALKVQVQELSASDSTSVIRNLQVQLKNADSARWREGEKTKDALKQVYALKKELKRLGAVEIPL